MFIRVAFVALSMLGTGCVKSQTMSKRCAVLDSGYRTWAGIEVAGVSLSGSAALGSVAVKTEKSANVLAITSAGVAALTAVSHWEQTATHERFAQECITNEGKENGTK